MNLIRPYVKIIDMVNPFACVAIYEPNPFEAKFFKKTIKRSERTSKNKIEERNWCWIYYDWCANPIGMSEDAPEGRLVYKLKNEDFAWMGYENAERYCEHLNREPNVEAKKEWEDKYGKH